MRVRNFWNFITNIGIDEHKLDREVIKDRLMNQLVFLSIVATSFTFLTYLITNENAFTTYTTVSNLAVELLGLFFAFRGKHIMVRHIAFILFPAVIAFQILFLGGNFGEANIFTAFAFGAFIMYEGRPKIQAALVVYICLLFIGTKFYAIENYYSPQELIKKPLAEIVTFPIVLIILGLILVRYQKELKRLENIRMSLFDNLESTNNELSKANDELEQFTYIASHDLKSPLRTISSHLDLIQLHLKKQDFDAIRTDIDFVKNGAKQMYSLINDILEYKEIGNQANRIEPVNLNELVETVKASLENRIQLAKAEVINRGLPMIKGRRNEFYILFQNLVENGIKYNSSPLPRVEISSQFTEDHLIFRVADNGIGIRAEYHDKIFQFFKRLHVSTDYEGTGIGLGLCKKIVQGYGGEITIESAEQSGSTFFIHLPKELLLS